LKYQLMRVQLEGSSSRNARSISLSLSTSFTATHHRLVSRRSYRLRSRETDLRRPSPCAIVKRPRRRRLNGIHTFPLCARRKIIFPLPIPLAQFSDSKSNLRAQPFVCISIVRRNSRIRHLVNDCSSIFLIFAKNYFTCMFFFLLTLFGRRVQPLRSVRTPVESSFLAFNSLRPLSVANVPEHAAMPWTAPS